MPLTKAEARLEALKLAVRPGLERATIIETAEEYYAFIVKDETQPPLDPLEFAKPGTNSAETKRRVK